MEKKYPVTLEAARVNVHLTQEKAAELIGVSKKTISNWETGISLPGLKYIKRIEQVYERPYDYIIFLPKVTL